jgi:hypothetical protein
MMPDSLSGHPSRRCPLATGALFKAQAPRGCVWRVAHVSGRRGIARGAQALELAVSVAERQWFVQRCRGLNNWQWGAARQGWCQPTEAVPDLPAPQTRAAPGRRRSLQRQPVPFSAGLLSYASWFEIPPGKKSHLVPNHCCYRGFQPLHTFAVRVHTHTLGRAVIMTRPHTSNKTGERTARAAGARVGC